MKQFAVILTLAMALMVITVPSQAQLGDYHFNKVTFTSGPGPLSSGLDMSVKLVDSTKTLQVVANDSRITLVHQWDLGMPSVAITGGFFQNTPWIGPRLVLDWTPTISTMHWLGYLSSDPSLPKSKLQPEYMFGWNSITVSIGSLDLSYALSSFRHNTLKTFPGASYTFALQDGLKVSPTVNWDVKSDVLMWQVGVTYQPQK